ncbi:hypothetical protein [Nocardiopsis sp. YSL2]|uniref:hypothetical protein n=1 Tax=Nocardiopsis sp. YSL2 TaxID=2939492 RepID=UPI0026F472BA|nr:hypothetical protein [Nocardiopsis sp. YSL2]
MDDSAGTAPGGAAVPARTAAPPSVGLWVLLCAGAEAVGMTAAVGAVVVSQALVGEPAGAPGVAGVVGLVLAGGLVEGLVLGSAQALGLRRWLPGTAVPWIVATVVVAGLGWAAGSLPSVLSDTEGMTEPAVPVVVGLAASLGALMGAALGAAQALVLRRRVAHPWRWVGASALAWAGAMPVIFLGASAAPAEWPAPVLLLLGMGTGTMAGAVLGGVGGWFLRYLD